MSDALTLGVAGYYAKGNNDAAETQLTSVNTTGWSFATFDYLGAMAYENGYDTFSTAIDQSANVRLDSQTYAIGSIDYAWM